MKSKVYFYNDYSDDFFKDDKEYKLKSSYKWIRNDIYSKVLSFLVAVHVSFMYFGIDAALVYLLGVVGQVIIILWSFIARPKKKEKK